MDVTNFIKRIVLVVACCLLLQAGMAQQSLQKTLQLPPGKLRLDSIAQLISRQTSFKFSINSSKVNGSALVETPSRSMSLGALLERLKAKLGVPFSIVGSHIIFSDHIAGQSNLQPAKPNKTVVKQPVRPRTTLVKQAAKPRMPNTKPSRVAATKPLMTGQPSVPNTQLAVENRQIQISPYAIVPTAQFGRIFGNNRIQFRLPSLYAHAGISSDDVMYSNVFAAFGKPWLYATASWGTRYSLEGFRYGIGSGIDLTDDWLLRIELTTGAFNKESDSSQWKTKVKSKLHRAAFLIERKLNQHLSIHGGILVNLLHTKYFLNDVPTAPESLVPKMGIDDGRLVIVKPLYTLSNNAAPDRPSSRQLWIGLQAGVIYRLNF